MMSLSVGFFITDGKLININFKSDTNKQQTITLFFAVSSVMLTESLLISIFLCAIPTGQITQLGKYPRIYPIQNFEIKSSL